MFSKKLEDEVKDAKPEDALMESLRAQIQYLIVLALDTSPPEDEEPSSE